MCFIWWLICAMSYKRVFGAKTRKVATRKPAKWWLWLVFAWRPFAPPGKDTTNSRRTLWWLICPMSYKRVFGGENAKGRHAKNPPNGDFNWFSHGDLSPRQAKIRRTGGEKATMKSVVLSCGGAKGRHAKTRKSHHLASRVATFRVFAPVCRIFAWQGERLPRKNMPNSYFGVFFAWRPFAPPGKDTTNRRRKGDAWKVLYFRVAGRKVAMRNHEKVTIWRVFAWGLFAFLPRKHDNTTWHKSATIVMNMWHGEQHMVWKWVKEHAQLEVGYSITVLHCNILQFNLKLCIVSVTVGWFLCGILNQLEYKSFTQEWVIK